MYGLTGKLVAQPGKRGQFGQILTRAAAVVGQMAGCHLYLVSEELADETTIWVIEVWDDKATHDASLQDEQVKALIRDAMPLMGGRPESREQTVIGGHAAFL